MPEQAHYGYTGKGMQVYYRVLADMRRDGLMPKDTRGRIYVSRRMSKEMIEEMEKAKERKVLKIKKEKNFKEKVKKSIDVFLADRDAKEKEYNDKIEKEAIEMLSEIKKRKNEEREKEIAKKVAEQFKKSKLPDLSFDDRVKHIKSVGRQC